MWDLNPPKILVGIENVGSEAALQYAVTDAARRGCGIHLVHVTRPSNRAACALDDLVMVEDELRIVGEAVLADAAARAEQLLDQMSSEDDRLSVSTELTHGSVVRTLDELSRHASLLVLQHAGMGPTGETPTLSVTAGAAAGAHCPVVAVPTAWRPSTEPAGVVVVGVDVTRRCVPLVRAGLHEAARRGAELRAVHAWRAAGAAATASEEADLLRTRLGEAVVEARADAGALRVALVVEPGLAGEVLLEQSVGCDLVVVGRHHRKHAVGAPLGRTVRELLRWSTVPVLVVDPLLGDTVDRARTSDVATAIVP